METVPLRTSLTLGCVRFPGFGWVGIIGGGSWEVRCGADDACWDDGAWDIDEEDDCVVRCGKLYG